MENSCKGFFRISSELIASYPNRKLFDKEKTRYEVLYEQNFPELIILN